MTVLAALGGLLAWSGCVFGPRVGGFQPAQGRAGVQAQLLVGTSRIAGELIDVRDTAIVILLGERLTLVSWRSIEHRTFIGMGEIDENLTGQSPNPDALRRLRLVSRFPQGMSPELEQRFLTALNQSDIDVLRGPRTHELPQ